MRKRQQPKKETLEEKLLRLSEEQLKKAQEMSKVVDEYCDYFEKQMEAELYKLPKKPGKITVDSRLLSKNLTKSQLN